MKKILILSIYILFTITVFAQEKRVVYRNTEYDLQDGDYVVDKDIDKYVGTWEWKSGKDSFTLIIKKKEKMKFDFGDFIYYNDMAVGWFRYIKNGVTIENSLDRQNAIITNGVEALNNTNATVAGMSRSDYFAIYVKFKDYKSSQDVRLEFVPGKTDELQWTVYYRNSPTPAKQEYFTIPVNMVLKKVNPANGGIIGGGLGSIIVQ